MPTTSFFVRYGDVENFFTLHDDNLEISYQSATSLHIYNLNHNEVEIQINRNSSFLDVTAFQGNKKLFLMHFYNGGVDFENEDDYDLEEASIFSFQTNDILIGSLQAEPEFIKFLQEKVYLFLLFEDAEDYQAKKIAKPLTDLLKEAISHDNIVYNIDYYVLNLDRLDYPYSYNNIKQKTLLYKDNLIAVLNQQPPLKVNDPLTRQEIKTITKIKFVEPIPIKSNLISTSNRKRSRSIGGGKKSKQTRKTKNKK